MARAYAARAAETVTMELPLTVPDPHALGGKFTLQLWGNGDYEAKLHLRGSGFDPYDFRVVTYVRTGAFVLGFMLPGSVGGTVGGGERNFGWAERSNNPMVALLWTSIKNEPLYGEI